MVDHGRASVRLQGCSALTLGCCTTRHPHLSTLTCGSCGPHSLSSNKLSCLPEELGALTTLCELTVADNPLIKPTPLVIAQGMAAILYECRTRSMYRLHGEPPPLRLKHGGIGDEIRRSNVDQEKALLDMVRSPTPAAAPLRPLLVAAGSA